MTTIQYAVEVQGPEMCMMHFILYADSATYMSIVAAKRIAALGVIAALTGAKRMAACRVIAALRVLLTNNHKQWYSKAQVAALKACA